jgi:hypothetical protein
MAGLEGIPWVTRCTPHGEQLVVERETSESGMFYFPWRVEGRGEMLLTTATVMEREEPYHLPLELARGTLNRLKGQMSSWQLVGLKVPKSFEPHLHEATHCLAKAATLQHKPEKVTPLANQALALTNVAMEKLCVMYGQQAFALRLNSGPLATLIGCRLENVPEGRAEKKILETFNAVTIPFLWREIETVAEQPNWEKYDKLVDWARQHGMKICGGPLMQFDKRSLPDWTYLWEDEWEELQAYILNHVTAVVNRYKGRVHLWNVAGRVNVDPILSISEEQMLRLLVEEIERVRNIDSRIPMVVSFDQPWSEHMGVHDRDLPPLHFADTLARAELGVAGFGLEINWGYWPQATPERDYIEVSRLIDRWTLLGHPLLITVTAPSNSTPDPLARHAAKPICDTQSEVPSAASQLRAVQGVLPILLAKSSVQAIFWNQWSDNVQHDFPHSGLIDKSGKAKPSLKAIAEMRKKLHG